LVAELLAQGVEGEYISRLQCMAAAIDLQMEEIFKSSPQKRIVLIIFNNRVNIIGDGLMPEVQVPVDRFDDYGKLIEFGVQALKPSELKPVVESKKELSEKLFKLEENGGTALGPALSVALGIASQVAHSEVSVYFVFLFIFFLV
jgi:hypothetical protein